MLQVVSVLREKIYKIYHHRINFFVGLSGFIVLAFLASPPIHQKIGNIFFGEIPTFYNVTFAEFFFKLATRPIIGKVPPYAHYQLSRTYFIQGELDSALKNAYKELEVHPENMRTYYILGLTLGYMDREEEAIEAFGKFIEWKPESWAARNDRAWLQFRIGDITGALETLEPIKTMMGNPWIQNTYGTLLMNKGMYKEAHEAFSFAKVSVDYMHDDAWGRAYPGNDPRIYDDGLEAMRISIGKNLKLLEELDSAVSSE